ncbi:hypothetical protein KUTeg_015383 [Tegillarca granosa]|uniref:Uncharacterized protein n=1 Tax=Tegillarca granosa TaxID=220873 RepID=A0ABQ9EQ01_TEGGR|nr:hypothetical protein KUTeg_015383 [Tegillarca granosa]
MDPANQEGGGELPFLTTVLDFQPFQLSSLIAMNKVISRNLYAVGMRHSGCRELPTVHYCSLEPDNPKDKNAIVIYSNSELRVLCCNNLRYLQKTNSYLSRSNSLVVIVVVGSGVKWCDGCGGVSGGEWWMLGENNGKVVVLVVVVAVVEKPENHRFLTLSVYQDEGGGEKCAICNKTVYAAERIEAGDKAVP